MSFFFVVVSNFIKLKMISKICLFKSVMRCLVRRYVTAEQRKSENTNITEDDINEVRPIYVKTYQSHCILE